MTQPFRTPHGGRMAGFYPMGVQLSLRKGAVAPISRRPRTCSGDLSRHTGLISRGACGPDPRDKHGDDGGETRSSHAQAVDVTPHAQTVHVTPVEITPMGFGRMGASVAGAAPCPSSWPALSRPSTLADRC